MKAHSLSLAFGVALFFVCVTKAITADEKSLILRLKDGNGERKLSTTMSIIERASESSAGAKEFVTNSNICHRPIKRAGAGYVCAMGHPVQLTSAKGGTSEDIIGKILGKAAGNVDLKAPK